MARFVTGRARLVVVVWVLLVGALALLGRNLDREATLHTIFFDGTQSKRAHDIAVREFGSEYALIVMLRGPRLAVDRQGRSLADRLGAMPHTTVASPWTPGAAIEGLRPRPEVGALIVRGESDGKEDVEGLLPPVERQLDRTVTGSVHASIAGFPAVVHSLRSANNEAVAIGELIAAPVLLLVLLFVFRSVLAALMPMIVGGAVVAATRGVLTLLLGVVELDLFALAVVGMIGLALGVDYSLLVVSRFREERERDDVAGAVQATVRATTRSVIPAGCGLILAVVAAGIMIPSAAATSVALAVSTATALSMLSALCVVPALLTLLGDNLDRWSLPRRRDNSQVAPLRWSRRILAHPRAVLSLLIALLFLSGWALTLDSGSASVAFLPSGDSGRQQQEEVERALGPGWLAPMEVVMDGRGAPVTSPERLRALAAFQRRVERDPGVKSMAGFAEIDRGAKRLRGLEGGLIAQERGLSKLNTGISRVHGGAVLNTSGLLKAAEGARQLDSGLGATHTGAGKLAGALEVASTGSSRLNEGLGRADEGSGKLAQGTTKASTGAGRIADALAQAAEKTGEIDASSRLLESAMRSGDDRLDELHGPLQDTDGQLAAAWQALQRMTAGRSDPEYAAAVRAVEEANRRLNGTDIRTGERADPSYGGVEKGIERAEGQFGVGLYLSTKLGKNGRKAESGIEKLADASAKLDRGLHRLATGSRQLSGGIARLSRGTEKLPPALRRLGEGSERLAAGLGLLETGGGRLAGGLGGGAQKSKLLSGALRKIGLGLERQQEPGGGGSQLTQLRTQSPGLFRSSYFVLAGLDGSPPARRNQLAFLVNLDRGGQDARMLVIPRDGPTSEETVETKNRLQEDAADLAHKTDAEVVVGGVAPSEIDANETLRDQAPLMRLALSLVTFLILLPVTRSLLIPLLAALLNLITVSASFGLLSVLFNGSLLGGPGYVDTTVIPATMIVMFGLAIDYEVFVFARIREEYVRTGSPSAAVRNGLDQTAHVVTGAAVIMIAVFLAFSVLPFISLRNFGMAQAIAVFIDAFIVRLVLIPAALERLGRWSWWMPGWLDRLLPGGTAVVAATERTRTS
jgi:putative drug exporter of the RND superfamily